MRKEDNLYPFLGDEIKLIERRLKVRRPTFGICLGAQLIAHTLGARVYPGPHKEIGWSPLTLTDAGRNSPLHHLSGPELHWHGDTFDLPRDATLLASTAACSNQAFSWSDNVLALQFHPEVIARNIEQWFIGHACEILAADGISVPMLRRDTARLPRNCSYKPARCFAEWLEKTFLGKIAEEPHENGSMS